MNRFLSILLFVAFYLNAHASSKEVSSIKIDHIFEGCSSLKYINISNLKTEKVEDMSYLFSECALLESIDLSDFITPNVINMTKMFYKCEKLINLN